MPQLGPKAVRLTIVQSEPKSARPIQSAGASPDIQVESLGDAASEFVPLLVRYYRELAIPDTPPLDPDWQGLLREETFGRVLFVTARHEQALVGFALNVLYTHVFHRAVPHAQTHEWIDPAYRVGLFGLEFLKRNIELLREKGIARAFIATSNERISKVYERVGYTFNEAVYAQVL